MSTTTRAQTIQQRSVEATGRLRQTLGLDDLKLLSTALAEVAADEIANNPQFANRVRAAYRDLLVMQKTRPLGGDKVRSAEVDLVPLPGTDGVRIDPYAPLDPYLLTSLYGSNQLRAALSVYTLTKLKQALDAVQQRNPDTKPTSRAKKDAIIDYIVEHVAGPGY